MTISENKYQYLDKYGRNEYTWKPLTAPDTVDRARRTLDALRNGQSVSVSMLQSVISLPEYPRSLRLLDDHMLLQACILRLFRLHRRDPTYPFGHEDGYLLFRVIVLVVGIRILCRARLIYNDIIDKIHENSSNEDRTVMLMEYVAFQSCTKILAQPDPYPYELFLGWSSVKLFNDHLITRPNVLILLNILWTDRQGFLQAWARSQAPGMFGMIAIFWRCVQTVSSTPRRWATFCEVLFRYHLVSGTDQEILGGLVNSARDHAEDWKQTGLGRVNPEDARMIMRAYIDRITLTSPLYPRPHPTALSSMAGFVFHLTELTRGTEDLFIPALRAGLENFWLTASGGRMIENSEFTIQPIDVASAVLPAYDMLNHLHNHLPGRVHEFVTASAELGIIEVLARGFVLIKEEPSFEEDGLFRQLYMACTNFGSTLAMVDPAEFRVSTFAPAFPDWYKALRYMRARDGMFNTHT